MPATATSTMPGLPTEPPPIGDVYSQLVGKIYVLNFKNKFKIMHENFIANDMADARQKALDYCMRFNLTFISTHPFLIDIMKTVPSRNIDPDD